MIRDFLEPRSNRETFTDDIKLYANRQLLDLTGMTAKVQLDRADGYYLQPNYLPYYPYDIFPPPFLLATTENGKATIVASSIIRFTFTVAEMATLSAGQYRLSAQATSADGTRTIQLFQFQIPIIDGGLPAP